MSDAHTHHHEHEHGHGHDFVSSNRKFFDEFASKYDERPLARELGAKISDTFLKEHSFDEKTTRVLDFACGTGLISQGIAPHARQIVGVDISSGMTNEYNRRVENQGIPSEEMRAIALDLLKDEGANVPEELITQLGGKFDVIVCSMAYHHIPSITLATSKLASLLNPTGKLLVADTQKDTTESNTDDSDPSTIVNSITSPTPNPFHASNFFDESKINFKFQDVIPHQMGIAEADMRAAFEGAGLADVQVRKRIRVRGSKKDGEEGEVKTHYIMVASGTKV